MNPPFEKTADPAHDHELNHGLVAHPGKPPLRKIRVLMVEDRASDAELILRELRRSGFEPESHRVDNEAAFVALLDPSLDIILADYSLPQFDGLEALRCLQERPALDIPFIIVTGSLGDERAAQCIKRGVCDYLLKDRLERLGLAVSNALDERRLRTERKLVDEQLRQAQKMEAIGQLAGGIAHDFNNMLTVINGHVGLLLEDSTLSPFTQESLKQVYMAGERAASLTRQLLFFSRKRPIERQSFDLNVVVEEVAALLRRLIGEQITLGLDLTPGVIAIEADVSMIEQILMNLVVNARDAMPAGRITVGSQSVHLTADDVRGKSAARPGSFACLWVQDTGCGIAPELMPRIFEPFFTTKEVGKGTGLGLATIFGIVQQHHGWVDVVSEVGVGTTFKVFLPIAGPEAQPAAKPDGVEAGVTGGRETILIVEDEATVREFTVAVLKPYGYRVLQARSGVEALEVWQRHSSRIDLLVTVLVMPDDISGPELAAKLQCEKPGLSVIFTSGYSEEMMGQVFGSRKIVRFVHKPYQPRVLARAVREILDGKTGSRSPFPPR
jgi:two-component system, cell cycle sensor histidine kinase and response regulator CckA